MDDTSQETRTTTGEQEQAEVGGTNAAMEERSNARRRGRRARQPLTNSLARAEDIQRTDNDAEQAAAPSDEIAGTTILLLLLP